MEFSSCEIPLFKRHVMAAINCTETEALHYFVTHFRTEGAGFFPSLRKLNDASGWCQSGGGDIYIWSENSYAVLFHEVVHAAFMLCRTVDMAIDEELIARLVEHMKLELTDKMEEVENGR